MQARLAFQRTKKSEVGDRSPRGQPFHMSALLDGTLQKYVTPFSTATNWRLRAYSTPSADVNQKVAYAVGSGESWNALIEPVQEPLESEAWLHWGVGMK